jgi:hypothetical protein
VAIAEIDVLLHPNLEWIMEILMKGSKVQMVLLKPGIFWQKEKVVPTGLKELLVWYFFPIVLLAGIAEFAGKMLWSSGFYLLFPLLRSLREIILYLLLYLVSVFVSNNLIKAFGGKKNLHAVKRIIAFSLAPVILVNVLTNLFPFLYVLEILGFYSFFIFIGGVESLLVFPEKKHVKYILITLLANFIVYSFLSILLSKLVTSFL